MHIHEEQNFIYCWLTLKINVTQVTHRSGDMIVYKPDIVDWTTWSYRLLYSYARDV